MPRRIEVRCSRQIADVIVASLRWFVALHYPRGADECSIAARESLLSLAERFEQELVQEGASAYSSRLRAFVCQAVKAYLAWRESETGRCYADRCRVVVEVCRGESDGAGFEAAERCDAACPGPGIV